MTDHELTAEQALELIPSDAALLVYTCRRNPDPHAIDFGRLQYWRNEVLRREISSEDAVLRWVVRDTKYGSHLRIALGDGRRLAIKAKRLKSDMLVWGDAVAAE